jgi:hypothetical protein
MKRAQGFATALLFLMAAGSAVANAQDDRGRGRGHDKQDRISPEEQQKRIHDQEERAARYKEHLDHQVPALQEQAKQLEQQRRLAQYRVQQEYAERLRQQQQSFQAQRDYSRDPYFNTPHTYHYIINGVDRQTNQYGADVLRQAVRAGYEEGFRVGEADRRDHQRPNYENSIAYRDASYGYSGRYVDQDDYNYYFRQGFRRGYDDGYYRRSQYGNSYNGTPSILANLLSSILGLQPIR